MDSDPPTDPDQIGPLPLRLGWFSAIGIGVVVVALAVAALVSQAGDENNSTGTDPNPTMLEPAPNFSVQLLDGTTFDLDQHFAEDGRPVILNFWASWCVPCRVEMPDFDQISQEKPGVKVVGIAVADTTENATDFASEIGVSYALGIDETETIAAAYPFIGLPSTWFIDENQQIIRDFAGQVDAETLREFLSADFGL